MNGVAPDLKRIFGQAVEIESPTERAAYLDEACGQDSPLRTEVERLLLAAKQAGSFMDGPAVARDDTQLISSVSEGPGTTIGPYKLLQQIGEGGMGIVFMAEQTEPIQRTVALKIIKPGMDTRQVIARFEAERQALAMMDHPNIAKVLDAGTTSVVSSLRERQDNSRSEMTTLGLPYFVMELVKGVPITKYCDEKQLSLRDRLELFLPVCQAAQHAHQKGIIHRDLKPNNVLVAEYDNHAVPKIIDFGVAKATAQKLTERTMFTEFGQVIGTVEYMSPEQAKFNQLDIDTRSDIYSLGVLLYELLAGSTPFERERLREAAFDEVLRIIREEEPPKPSTRLSTADALPSIAANRHTEPARLGKEVSGDLDWIVMKCLEKDRNRRYETANGLSRDIERHLADQPVEARRPSGAYRFKKFLRRNKVGVLACVSILIALVVGLALASTGYLQARRQAAVTGRITQYMKQMLFSADPASAKPPNYTVRELLDDFSLTIDAELADDPEVAVVLYSTIGNAYAELTENQRALQHLSQALALKRSIYGPRHENYADGLIDYARGIYLSQVFGGDSTPAKYDEGVAKVNEALDIYRARGIEGQRIIHALWALQLFYGSRANWAGVERVAHEAAAEAAKTPRVTYWEISPINDSLVTATIANGNLANAERMARENLDADVAKHGMNSLQTAWAYRNYGEAFAAQKKYKEAIQADDQALAIMRKLLGPGHLYLEHPRAAIASHLAGASQAGALGDVVGTVEELAKKELLFRENLHLPPREPRRKFDPPVLAAQSLSQFPAFYLELGKELARAGKTAEAETARDRARRLAESLVAELDDRPEFLPIVYAARLDSDSTKDGDKIRRQLAGQLSQLALKIQRVKDPTTSAGALYLVALLQLQVGDNAGYRATCQALVDLPFDKIEGDMKSVTIWTLCIGQDALDDPNLPVKFSKDFVATRGEPHDGLCLLGASLYRAGQYEQAADRLKEFVAAFPRYAPSRLFLAMTQWKLGRRNEARELLSETLPTVDKVLQSHSMEWNRRAMLEILRDEAVALIGQTETDEPVGNKSRSKDESKKPPSTPNPKP